MKKLTYYLIVFYLSGLVASPLLGQDIDGQKMKKDIQVAEKILLEMMNAGREKDNGFTLTFNGQESSFERGFYVKGQGVVLKMPSQGRIIRNLAIINNYQTFQKGQGQVKILTPPAGTGQVVVEDKDKNPDLFVSKRNYPSSFSKEDVRKVMQDFIVKYAVLVGQLKPDEKIVIVYEEKDPQGEIYLYSQNQNHEEKKYVKLTAEIEKRALSEYKSGAISEENLIAAIRFNEEKIQKTDAVEFKVLARIINTLYENGEQEEYRIHDNVSYNRIVGFGVTYDIPFHLEYEETTNQVLENYEVIFREDLEAVDSTNLRNKEKKYYYVMRKSLDSLKIIEKTRLQEAIVKIESEMKGHLLEYGRTLSSLEKDEVVVFNVTLNKWMHYFENEEKLRRKLSISREVLDAYDQKKIGREEALRKIEISN